MQVRTHFRTALGPDFYRISTRRSAVRRRTLVSVSVQPSENRPGASLEVAREEALRRGRPFPRYEEMVIEELTDEESEAFWAAIIDL